MEIYGSYIKKYGDDKRKKKKMKTISIVYIKLLHIKSIFNNKCFWKKFMKYIRKLNTKNKK